jgi:DNA-binding response OmpR family regulator
MGARSAACCARAGVAAPIIMLTAADTDVDTFLGFDSGANGYITKPFRMGVLLVRLRERGRRLVSCAEALVTNEIPADKLAPCYLLRRAFRSGQTTAFLPSALSRPRRSAVGAVEW